jgi:hypothetical protein
VSLALNVKYRVLERLERLTGGKIISSVDSMLTGPTLGTSHTFYTMRGDLADPASRHRQHIYRVFFAYFSVRVKHRGIM